MAPPPPTPPHTSSSAAAQVLQGSTVQSILSWEDRLALMIAALMHDLDHDGHSNSYHMHTQSNLARLYNDRCGGGGVGGGKDYLWVRKWCRKLLGMECSVLLRCPCKFYQLRKIKRDH